MGLLRCREKYMEIKPFKQLTKPPPKINKIHIIKKCPYYHLVESSRKNSTCFFLSIYTHKKFFFSSSSSKLKITVSSGQIKVVLLWVFRMKNATQASIRGKLTLLSFFSNFTFYEIKKELASPWAVRIIIKKHNHFPSKSLDSKDLFQQNGNQYTTNCKSTRNQIKHQGGGMTVRKGNLV